MNDTIYDKIQTPLKEEEVVKYSVNPYFDIDAMKFNKSQAKDLDDIINNNPVKIG